MFISNTKYVASGSADNTVRIWNYIVGDCINILSGHTSDVYPLIEIPNTKYIASGSHDNTVKIWNYESG